ncbi:hypothetical protein [Thermococcus sp. AM4]|uniref:hypothetical protein n=1 Tax=Thermococcus sp. (strain AM4) TaxID=246969 RepID=UPI00022998DC|nr:hypothetical protein [Thermococcus sp. AM4]EEB74648.2 hypothetical protein TAM4_593 [Thermococcus sp. AM4]
MRGPFPDQVTVKRSEMLAEEKQKRFLRESEEPGGESILETAVVVILGLLVFGFVIFVLKNYL